VATTHDLRQDPERLDLARAQDFAIGDLIVHPSTREIESEAGSAVLEPRVMQVLVTLHAAKGRVVSREELTATCWEGRIVGDDAINRVLSRLRRVAEENGGGSFRIETITKVGYRLVEIEPAGIAAKPETKPDAALPKVNRRRALIALGCAGTAAVVGGGLWAVWPRQRLVDPRLAALMKQAEFAVFQDTSEGFNQAIGLYRKALAINPDDAEVWGTLAVIYACLAQWRPTREASGLRTRAIEAANRSAMLDPGNGFAPAARIFAKPARGNWIDCERSLRRAMDKHGRPGVIVFSLALVLTSVGRGREAAALLAGARPIGEIGPGFYYREILALWASDQLDAADRLIDEARFIYPTHFTLWFAECFIKLHSGRAGAALAMIDDVDGRPTGVPIEEFEEIAKVARAVISRDFAEGEAAMRVWVECARRGAGYAENAIQFAAALGRLDDAFRVTEAYYFGRGFDVPEVRFTTQQGSYTPMAERETAFLFYGSMGRFRADPRFERLLQEVGLQDYWVKANVKPDYRVT
jgi:DNA-binding winged helix-turn-helix (wHTH) protein